MSRRDTRHSDGWRRRRRRPKGKCRHCCIGACCSTRYLAREIRHQGQ